MRYRILSLTLAVLFLVSPPHAQSQHPNQLHPISHVPLSGEILRRSVPTSNTTTIILDGTLAGYDLRIIASKLDKPCPQWYLPFLAAGWPESEWPTARWIIFRESRCDQYAWNGQDAGLLQINKIHRPLIESYSLRFPEDLYNPETNLWIAHLLWLRYGWEPWTYKGVVPK